MLPILTGIKDRLQQGVSDIGVVQDIREMKEGLATIANFLSSITTFFKRLKNEPGMLLWDGFTWIVIELNKYLVPICIGASIVSLILIASGSKNGRGWLYKSFMFYLIIRFLGVAVSVTN